MVKAVANYNFKDEVLNSAKPVLVDFYADWCGPCKMLAPVINELSSEPISQKVDFAKLNIDSDEDVAAMYGVMSVPTLILFKGGEEVLRLVGLRPKEDIASAVEEYIK